MFFFSKRSKYSDFSSIGVDMHSHLTPGVDDGAKDVQNSLSLISGLKELGFSHLYTTPHTLGDIHPNTSLTLQKGFSLLDGQLPEGIQMNLSSEYYLDSHFIDQVERNELLPLPGNRLLIEFSQISKPMDLEQQFFDLGIKGYQIILAHPERYLFFHKNFDYYKRLKDTGVEFQVNALSLTPHYGEKIKTVAEKLIDMELVDFIGTDTHHLNHIEALKNVPKSKYFAKLIDSGMLKNESLITK